MDARERGFLFQAYKEDCRALAYLYVELILQHIAALPPHKGDTIIRCGRPQDVFPRRTSWPRYADVFREVALILIYEYKYNVKWSAKRAPFFYVRWMDVRDGFNEIDSVGELPPALPPPVFRPPVQRPTERRAIDASELSRLPAPPPLPALPPGAGSGAVAIQSYGDSDAASVLESLRVSSDRGWLDKLKEMNKRK